MMSGMKHTIQSIKKILTETAEKHKDRDAFNAALKNRYECIGCGAYRSVVGIGAFAVKLRAGSCCYGSRALDACNRVERKNYLALTEDLRFFVLEPKHVRLPNGHDAVIMPKVMVVDHDRYDWSNDDPKKQDRFTKLMLEQLCFIQSAFADTHSGNIGFDVESERVWLIDYNHGAEHECRDKSHTTRAKRLIKCVTRSTKSKRKAA